MAKYNITEKKEKEAAYRSLDGRDAGENHEHHRHAEEVS